MLSGEVFDLSGLRADNIVDVLKLPIYCVLIFDIDQWRNEEDASTQHSKTPERKDLDQPVRGQSCNEYLSRVRPIFLVYGMSSLTVIVA